jgi:hypothetical protein
MTLVDTLSTAGIRAFGDSMPLLAPEWSAATPTEERDGLALSLAGGTWRSPLATFVRTPAELAERAGIRLVRPDGTGVPAGATVLSLYPVQYLRLARLLALVLEDPATARPGRDQGLPARPTPAHVVLEDGGGETGGLDPGDDVGVGGLLSFHDHLGQPIDAVAVASVFLTLMQAHQPLQFRDVTDAFDPNPPLAAMVTALAGATPAVRVRLVDGDGRPRDGTNLTGLTAVDDASGLHALASGSLVGTIGKETSTGATGAFSDDERRTLLVGLATTARLGDQVTLPARPPGSTPLARDFFTVRVVDLRSHLLGTPATAWEGTRLEPRPAVRRDEPVQLLADGNDVLGAATAALTGAVTESIVVAPEIDGAFAAPSAPGAGAHWPAFPPVVGTPAPAGAVPIALRDALTPAAAFLDDGASGTPDIDVVLTLNGLPPGAAVRAYHRVFSPAAVETRGDGAGTIADDTGTVRLVLRDPLGLRRPGQPAPDPVPAQAILHVDVVVVKRTGESRMFGDVTVPILGTATAPPGGTNAFAGAARRAICRAGILGLASSALPPAGTDPLAAALTLVSEGTPRDAPRLPGMARRDLIVAGLGVATGGAWSSVVSAGRLRPELHHADARIGAPGGGGGREVRTTGVATANGRLAFDVARAAFRRTTSVYARLSTLAGAAWGEPAAPAPLPEDSAPSATQGTFAGAVLQTVAAGCETPELSVLRTANIVDPDDPALPRSFDELVDAAQAWLTNLVNQLPAGLPARTEIVNRLTSFIDDLDDLKDDNTVDESTRERLFNEVLREIAASGWGRRDAQWALHAAFARAQRFVYIETPGIGPTAASGAGDPFAVDLWAALGARLTANPALHVAVCCPQQPDFPFGFNPFTDYEAAERRTALLGLPTANVADPVGSRVVVFHPIGFPGRPCRLETTVVIVDDVWALVGSSTLRRRGLAFDGGADIVLADADLVEGRSPAIAAFRRALQAERLGIAAPGAPPALPPSSFVRLADGVEAFHEIREMLRAGGLGRIARLAPPEPLDDTASPGPIDAVNPDGETVDLPVLLALLALAGSASA